LISTGSVVVWGLHPPSTTLKTKMMLTGKIDFNLMCSSDINISYPLIVPKQVWREDFFLLSKSEYEPCINQKTADHFEIPKNAGQEDYILRHLCNLSIMT